MLCLCALWDLFQISMDVDEYDVGVRVTPCGRVSATPTSTGKVMAQCRTRAGPDPSPGPDQ